MRQTTAVVSTIALSFALASSSFAAEQEVTKSLLQVIRLKAGEHRFIEVALPHGEFRPAGKSGRSDFAVQLFPGPPDGKFIPIVQDKPTESEFFKATPYRIAEGVTLRWSENKPGIELQASQNAPLGTQDIRVTYTNFGFEGPHAIGFRIIIESEK